MIVAILGIGCATATATGSTAAGKPGGKPHAPCAKASESKAKRATPRTKCKKRPTHSVVAEVSSLLHGIPEEHERLGSPDAPVTLVMFGDLECPSCRYVDLYTLPTVINEFVRSGKLKIEYHSFQSITIEPEVFEDQQVAALAAGQQDKMWYYVEFFYHEQGQEYANYVNENYLDRLARQVPGLNIAEWMAARSDTNLAEQIERDEQIGLHERWESTPDFFLGDGTELRPFHPRSAEPSAFAKAIQERLAIAER